MTFAIVSAAVGLALATFVSEDAACVSGGILASRGQLPLVFAIVGCAVGIFVSDLAIILAGRLVARGVNSRWTRWVSPSTAKLAKAEHWFDRHGLWVVLASRFVPGTRSATCFAAGVLRVPMRKFALVFLLASAVWTPCAVGAVYYAGRSASALAPNLGARHIAGFLAFAVLLAIAARLAFAARTWRGRRMLLARWRRLTRWEFWPSWILYIPVAVYVVWLSIRYRGWTLFTNANPGIPAGGGLKGESKSEILEGLRNTADVLPVWVPIAGDDQEQRISAVKAFIAERQLSYPIVLKPDAGDRGQGVVIARNLDDVISTIAAEPKPLIAQEYVPGVEFGVFYFRHPFSLHGEILAITDKRMIQVTGDGRSTLETLILADDRAVCMARFFLKKFENRLNEVPAAGAKVPLTELGTHCRGALFLDGEALLTPELHAAVERVSRGYDGFYFGRYDLRASSIEAFQAGKFKVIELNGLTSEATSIYDPRHSVFFGWRTLCRQWRIAVEIGAENRKRGHKPMSVAELYRLVFPKTQRSESKFILQHHPKGDVQPVRWRQRTLPSYGSLIR